MDLCIISPRFHPVVGGNENYLKNIAKFCSETLRTTVVTSNLISTIEFLRKQEYIESRFNIIPHNIKIIRASTLKNYLLRIIFYYNEFIIIGIEKLIDKLTKQKDIYNTEWINEKLQKRLVRLIFYQKYFTNPCFYQIFFILKKIQKYEKIKLIHSSPLYFTANLYAFRFSKKKKIPFICTPLIHINPYKNEFFTPSFNYILKNSDAIIALTNLEKIFYSKYGIAKNKIHVIPPGIDPNDYEKPDVEKFKIRYNILRESPLLLYIGTKTFYKGVQNTIYALKYLIPKFRDIKLVVIGPDTREYYLFLKKLPTELKSHIIDLGVVNKSTLSNAYASCDIFLLPSVDDSYGIVYLEAWLFKKPVIGALEGNISDVIEDGVNGILVSFKDVKKFALKIEELLNNYKLRDFLGNNGYNKLIRKNLISITGKQVLELYEKFL